MLAGYLGFLIVNWKGYMSDAALIKRMPTSFIGQHFDLVGIDYFLIIDSDVIEQTCHVYFLLEIAAFKIRKSLTGKCENGSLIELGVIESIEKMNSARARGC